MRKRLNTNTCGHLECASPTDNYDRRPCNNYLVPPSEWDMSSSRGVAHCAHRLLVFAKCIKRMCYEAWCLVPAAWHANVNPCSPDTLTMTKPWSRSHVHEDVAVLHTVARATAWWLYRSNGGLYTHCLVVINSSRPSFSTKALRDTNFRQRTASSPYNNTFLCTYIYIYIHVQLHMYIYIYI